MSIIRKIGLLVGITGLGLAMASGTGFAITATYFVTIDDTAANDDVVFYWNFANSSSTGTTVAVDAGGLPWVLDGTLRCTSTPFCLDPGTFYVILTEGDGGPISDIVSLKVGPAIPNTGDLFQAITVTFQSDYPDPTHILTDHSCVGFPSNTCTFDTIAENGTFQNMSQFTNPGNQTLFLLFVASDMSDVSAVPEPASLLLLSSGLAGLAWWRRRRLLLSAK